SRPVSALIKKELSGLTGVPGAGNPERSKAREPPRPAGRSTMTTDTRFVEPDVAAETKSGWRPLLDRAERAVLALRLTLSLAAFCLLLVAVGIRFIFPDEMGIAELVAGGAAALVAIPVLVAAWESIIHPSLDGVTERLIALATIAAWATGDLMTAAILPIVM